MSNGSLDEQLLTAFRSMFAALFRGRMDRLLSEKLTMPQFKVLAVVARIGSTQPGPGTTVGGLARRLSLSAPTVTGIVDRLRAAGFVERKRVSADRRVVEVVATERGRQLLAEVFTAGEERLRRIFAVMNEEDARAFLRGLLAFQEAVITETGGE